jgi:hypothetical protein
MESSDALQAMEQYALMEQNHLDPLECARSPQWREMLKIRRNKDIRGEYRPFDEEGDADFGIRQAQETMERGVSEMDNSPTFLA